MIGLPVIRGVIDRRILVNWSADPEVVARTLPAPFRPKVHRGRAWVGICLIRLRNVRPWFAPAWMGIGSENAAHRTAVEWDEAGRTREGVFVRRRDTDSRLNALAGGRVFPGLHSHARFRTVERDGRYAVSLRSDDGVTHMSVRGRAAGGLPAGSRFADMREASDFFAAGSTGFSVTPEAGRFEGLELRCRYWAVEPLAVEEVRSSVFDDRTIFPAGSIAFDCALLMRGIEHEWHALGDLHASECGVSGCRVAG